MSIKNISNEIGTTQKTHSGGKVLVNTAVKGILQGAYRRSGIKNILFLRPGLCLLIVINYLFLFSLSTTFLSDISFILLNTYTLGIALSGSGAIEWLFRLFEDARNVATFTEKERLISIFNAVKSKALEYGGLVDDKVKLYIVDNMTINSFVIGKRTIVITRGLMHAMNDVELESVIAHEMAHIIRGDGQASMFVTITSNVCIWGIALLIKVLKIIEDSTGGSSLIGGIISWVRGLLEMVVKYVLLLLNILVASNSRVREYAADRIAFEMGYGEGLLSALYKFYDIESSDKRQVLDRWQASHPRTAYRIEKLEHIIEFGMISPKSIKKNRYLHTYERINVPSNKIDEGWRTE